MNYGLIAFTTLALLSAHATSAAAQAGEGIRVRGHWTLTVRNADGSVASRAAFDNALTQVGEDNLVDLISGQRVARYWVLQLTGSPRYGTIFRGYSSAVIGTAAPPFLSDRQVFRTLTQKKAIRPLGPVAPGDCASYCLELRGTATAEAEGVLRDVFSYVAMCDSASPECTGQFGNPFAHTAIPDSTPITYPDGSAMPDGLHIEAGQTVEVTVLISFGAAPHQPPG
jgi:hypothetical protein